MPFLHASLFYKHNAMQARWFGPPGSSGLSLEHIATLQALPMFMAAGLGPDRVQHFVTLPRLLAPEGTSASLLDDRFVACSSPAEEALLTLHLGATPVSRADFLTQHVLPRHNPPSNANPTQTTLS